MSQYRAPAVLAEVAPRSADFATTLGKTPLGKATRLELFSLDSSFTFLNHGAFGAALRPLQDEAQAWRARLEAQPLRFYDREMLPLVAHAVREMAVFLGCPATELFPLPNVTAGLNAVFASVEPSLSSGDIVACTSLTYGSTKKMLAALAQRTGCSFVIIPVTLPVSPDASSVGDDVCHALQRMLPAHGRLKLKLVVLDTVTSNTAIRLPVGSISRRIRKIDGCSDGDGGPFIIADAAHSFMTENSISLPTATTASASAAPAGPGGAEDLRGIDAWLTNLHKWGCAPRGVGFMWASSRLQKILRPAIISHGFDVPVPAPLALSASPPPPARPSGARLLSGFSWDGCRDYAALLTTPSTLSFWSRAAPEAISYSSSLLSSGVMMLRQEWRPSEAAAPRFLIRNSEEGGGGRARVPTMTLVPLPDRVAGGIDTTKGCSDAQAFALQNALYEQGVEVPVKCIGGRLYLRISCHIHNDEDDFARLAAVLKKI